MGEFEIINDGHPTPSVDIVFIHGLGGDGRKTWTHSKSEEFWPDFLAKDIPNARIMSYSYDPKLLSVRRPASTSKFDNHARTFIELLAIKRIKEDATTRKVVFVAHSLGGLLVAQALRMSDNEKRDPRIKQIVSCTIGLLLFGVPFGGSDLAGPAKIFSSLLGLLRVRTVNKKTLGLLVGELHFREDLREFLINLIRKRRKEMGTLCVTEEYKQRRQLAVSQTSGSLPGGSNFTAGKNHSDLPRFENKFDKGYEDIRDGYLVQWLHKYQPHNKISYDKSTGEDKDISNDDGQTKEEAESSIEKEKLLHQIGGQSSGSKSTDEDEGKLVNDSQRRSKGGNMEKHDRVAEEDRIEKEAIQNNFTGSTNNKGTYQGFGGGNFYRSYNVLNQITNNAPTDERTPQKLDTIPVTSETYFIDREKLLDEVEKACEAKTSREASRTALLGLGGTGKSKLAITYGNRFMEKNPKNHWVLWIKADCQTNLKSSFKDIARQLNIRDRNKPDVDYFQIVCETLRDEETIKWLLIFDNVDDLSVFDQAELNGKEMQEEKLVGQDCESWYRYFPKNSNGSILITSRNKNVTDAMMEPPNKTVTVEGMTEEEALVLFKSKLPQLPILNDWDTHELLNKLDRMPLAIVQAASYIRQEIDVNLSYSVEKYLGELLKYSQDEEFGCIWAKDPKNQVFTTWETSLDRIKEKRPSAVKLLYLMSCFDRQGIPRVALFKPDEAKGGDAVTQALFKGRGQEIKKTAYEDEGFEEDIRLLRAYSLISPMGNDCYQIHPLVHSAAKKWRNADSSSSECFKSQFIINLLLSFPRLDGSFDDFYATLLPHLNVALNRQPSSGPSFFDWSLLMLYSADYAINLGNHTDAERFSEAVIASIGTTGSPELAVANCYFILGAIWRFRNDSEISEKRLKEAKRIIERMGGEQIPKNLDVLRDLASLRKSNNSQDIIGDNYV